MSKPRYITKASIQLADSQFEYELQADLEEIERLASLGMSENQVCAKLKLNRTNYTQRSDWQEAYNRGFGSLAEKILTEQLEIAMDRNHRNQFNMLIHLGKTILKQKEASDNDKNITVTVDESYKELMKLIGNE